MAKINSSNIFKDFEKSVRVHGAMLDLNSLAQIASYIGMPQRTFSDKVKKLSFDYLELRNLFKKLHYTKDEINVLWD